jgi:DNA-binding IclR family transcriptional regulator
MKRNQSVHKAAAILRAAAAQPDGETASGLARAAGLPQPTALRLIHTLEEEGFLTRLSADGRYVLGAGLLRLGGEADTAQLLIAAARGALAELAEQVRETATLSVPRGRDGIEVVFQIDGPHLIRAISWVGGRYPLHASSGGKVVLSTWDAARLDSFLCAPLERCASKTITDPDALRRETDRVREQGYSAIVDELEDGLAAVSAPVFYRDGSRSEGSGRLLGIVNVSGPSFRFDAQARTRAVPLVRATAEKIERELRSPVGAAA